MKRLVCLYVYIYVLYPKISNFGEFNILHLVLVFQSIGAEYGEGFETFRPDGPLKIDVVRSSGGCFMFTGIELFVEYII